MLADRIRAPRAALLRSLRWSVAGWLLAGLAVLSPASAAQPPDLGPARMLPGDDARPQAIERQTGPDLAAGAGIYLAVWTDERVSSLTGFRLTDVYAARLDASGGLIDREPILVSTADHEQYPARVAWNGSHWLVVFRTDRETQFYLEEDIVGVRVDPQGEVVDASPIVIAPGVASDAGDPDVASDGDGWAVVWPQFNDVGVRGVRGTRVAADGTVAVSGGTPIWYDANNTYAYDTRLVWGGSQYLLAWNKSGLNVWGLRLDAQLAPLDAQPFHVGRGGDADVAASDGGDFYVVFEHATSTDFEEARGARVSAAGAVLDPGGVTLSSQLFISDFSPAVAWNGTAWTTFFSGDGTGSGNYDFDLKLRTVATDGQPVEPAPVPVDAGESYPTQSQLAPRPGGGVQAVWQRDDNSRLGEDIAATAITVDEPIGALVEVSVGLPRQLLPTVSDGGPDGTRLLVFTSQVSGAKRVLGQRIGADGRFIDAEPHELAVGADFAIKLPRAAWNGQSWLVVWQQEEGVMGRRFDADLAPIDPAPTVYLVDHEDPAVAALGSTFLVLGAEVINFHEPQRWLRFVRVDAAGVPIESEPVDLAFGYEKVPRAAALGGRWLVVWESQTRHDRSASSIDLAWISAAGVVETVQLGIDGTGYGDDPDIGLGVGGAFLVWHDDSDFGNAQIEGRSLAADGTLGPILTLIAEPKLQVVARIDRHQDGWLMSWVDTRHLSDLAETRADVYAARLAADGTVLDPGGFSVASTPRPELDSEVVGLGDVSLLLYAGPPDQAPSGFRLLYRGLGDLPAGEAIFSDGFESGDHASWTIVFGAQ